MRATMGCIDVGEEEVGWCEKGGCKGQDWMDVIGCRGQRKIIAV